VLIMPSRKFNQSTGEAKKAARKGPVFITERGSPAYVLLSIEEYRRITGKMPTIVDLLAMPGAGSIEFEPRPLSGELWQPADFS